MGFRKSDKKWIRKRRPFNNNQGRKVSWDITDDTLTEDTTEDTDRKKFSVIGFTKITSLDSVPIISRHEHHSSRYEHYSQDISKTKHKDQESSIKVSGFFTSILFKPMERNYFFRNTFGDLSSISDKSSHKESIFHSIKGFASSMFLLNYQRDLFKQSKFLNYRERVFRAAWSLKYEMPSYPDWAYVKDIEKEEIYKINVGGVIFHLFNKTLDNFLNTKLVNCIKKHKGDGTIFFDRDHKCFKAVLNFYRNGHLHVPPNICLSFFEEELEFWGINELFIEPCCWSSFNTLKVASIKMRKFSEDLTQSNTFESPPTNFFMKWRMKIYSTMTKGSGSLMARWLSTISTLFILISIFDMIVGSTSLGRVDIHSNENVGIAVNETVTEYYWHTKVMKNIVMSEFFISLYFLTEVSIKFFLTTTKLEFLTDTLNWVDLIATISSILSYLIIKVGHLRTFEGYVVILKLPRILRLFKLSVKLRIGMEAFVLTLKASANELKLVLLMLFTAASFFGSLIFVAEMVNENKKRSQITSAFTGLWFSLATMSTVGYGDFRPTSMVGQLITFICILCGVIICQLPVPVFIQNFRLYHNQASARLSHSSSIIIEPVDPEYAQDHLLRSRTVEMKNKGRRTYSSIFKAL